MYAIVLMYFKQTYTHLYIKYTLKVLVVQFMVLIRVSF